MPLTCEKKSVMQKQVREASVLGFFVGSAAVCRCSGACCQRTSLRRTLASEGRSGAAITAIASVDFDFSISCSSLAESSQSKRRQFGKAGRELSAANFSSLQKRKRVKMVRCALNMRVSFFSSRARLTQCVTLRMSSAELSGDSQPAAGEVLWQLMCTKIYCTKMQLSKGSPCKSLARRPRALFRSYCVCLCLSTNN